MVLVVFRIQWQHATYLRLELGEVCWAQSIGLGNNGNQVDTSAEPLHNLNVQGLQSVASGSDEVQAGVDTQVDLIGAAWLLFLQHVRLMLIVQELDDGLPRVTVVHVVSEAWGVDNGEADYQVSIYATSAKLFDSTGLIAYL
jgi:hypothetical protein